MIIMEASYMPEEKKNHKSFSPVRDKSHFQLHISRFFFFLSFFLYLKNCSLLIGDGAMVLSKLSVPGRPTTLGKCRARPYCTCSRCR